MRTPGMETERLFLREVQQADLQEILDCRMQDEDVSRYMWIKNRLKFLCISFSLFNVESGKFVGAQTHPHKMSSCLSYLQSLLNRSTAS